MPEHQLKNCKQRMLWKLCIDFKRATLEIPSKEAGRKKITRLQGWQEKSRGREKLKRVLINQVNG